MERAQFFRELYSGVGAKVHVFSDVNARSNIVHRSPIGGIPRGSLVRME